MIISVQLFSTAQRTLKKGVTFDKEEDRLTQKSGQSNDYYHNPCSVFCFAVGHRICLAEIFRSGFARRLGHQDFFFDLEYSAIRCSRRSISPESRNGLRGDIAKTS